MPRKLTKQPSKNGAHASSTGLVFPELKNTFNNPKHQRGIKCEEICSKFLEHNQFQLLAHRHRTPFSEIDLIFFKNHNYYLIEVKSYSHEWAERALSKKQARRLLNSLQFLQAQTKDPVHLHLALVNHKNQLKIYTNILNEFVF